MEYVTRDGVRIEVGRVLRRFLDAIHIPAPVPPSRVVETWGGLAEDVPDYQDAGYQAQLFEYRLAMWRAHLDIIVDVVNFQLPEAQCERLAALQAIGVGDGTPKSYLRYGLAQDDQNAIVALVLYQSTVTQRGIDEAAARFAYKWRGKPLLTWYVPSSHGERGQLALEWRAAIRSGLTWAQFCTLPGPEQSQHVAFWLLEDKLAYLLQSQAN